MNTNHVLYTKCSFYLNHELNLLNGDLIAHKFQFSYTQNVLLTNAFIHCSNHTEITLIQDLISELQTYVSHYSDTFGQS